jgi:hypothetical protein
MRTGSLLMDWGNCGIGLAFDADQATHELRKDDAMLQVQFNSQQLESSILGLDELPRLLAELEDRYLPEGSFIRDVLLDGESLVANGSLDFKNIPAERVDRAQCINVISRTLQEVTAEAVDGARTYLAGLEQPISIVASQFNSGQFDKAYSNLGVLLDGVSNIINLVGSLESSFGIDCGSVVFQRASVTTHLKDLRFQLQELVQAQARQDTVAIADLLEYELRPRMSVWLGIFSTFLEQVGLQPSAIGPAPKVSES